MPPEQEPENLKLKQIRTFQGDVAETLQRQSESIVSIRQAERLKRESAQAADNTLPRNSKRTGLFLLLLGSLLLFALGTLGAWYAYNEFVRKITAPTMAAPSNRFISANIAVNLDLATTSRETLVSTLAAERENVPVGEVGHINLRRRGADGAAELLPTSEFLDILESQAPGSLVRSFDPLFMLGVFGESPTAERSGASAFLIIKLASFENAFAGMLAWEKNMSRDIGPLFATARLLVDAPVESAFIDITDRNKDIRALVLEDQTVLLYSFFDNNMLIITDSVGTLRTLLERLTREKLSR